tara:strand:- start:54 stop:449 length:396 start_codon:yes stop_codon:yes gene_type:complete
MKSKELRIGNYVIYNSEVVKVNSVGRVYLSHKKKYVSHKILVKNYSPIPLTEEWLLKFGFDKDSNNDYCIKGFHLEDRNIDTFLSVEKILKLKDNFGCWYFEAYLRELKNVHQLQNLYFALTNEELTIRQL